MSENRIEAMISKEWLPGAWGEFLVDGLNLTIEGRQHDKYWFYHSGYAIVPDGTIFSVWYRRGYKGTRGNDYYILMADTNQPEQEILGGYHGNYGFVCGRWQVLAHGDGMVRAVLQLIVIYFAPWGETNDRLLPASTRGTGQMPCNLPSPQALLPGELPVGLVR